jgi:hypothetical protein
VSLLHPLLPERVYCPPLERLQLLPRLRSNGVDPLQNPELGRAHRHGMRCGIEDVVLRHRRKEIALLAPTREREQHVVLPNQVRMQIKRASAVVEPELQPLHMAQHVTFLGARVPPTVFPYTTPLRRPSRSHA